jgi:hypothetical protein
VLAAAYHGPEDLHVEEHPTPTVGADDALLRVVSAGVCANTPQAWYASRVTKLWATLCTWASTSKGEKRSLPPRIERHSRSLSNRDHRGKTVVTSN